MMNQNNNAFNSCASKCKEIFYLFPCRILVADSVTFGSMKVKKAKIGRPAGPKKVPLNAYLTVERKQAAQKKAKEMKWGVSTLIESALEIAYGI